MKKLLTNAAESAAGQALMSALERADGSADGAVRVLTYHRVTDADGFDEQMRYLADRYVPVPVPDLLAAAEGQHELPARAVAVTFDDAYVNFAEVAWPVLKRHGVPVTLFVPTGFPDGGRSFWWDDLELAFAHTARRDTLETPAGAFPLGTPDERDRAHRQVNAYVKHLPHDEVGAVVAEIVAALGHAPESRPVLGWDELRALAAEGVTLGAHTRTHPLLTRVDVPRAREEIAGSLKDLHRETGEAAPLFAYPAGAYNAGVVAAAREAGVRLAFTTVKGANDLRQGDLLRLRRINVKPDANAATLRARLLLYTARLNSLRPVPSAA